MWRNPNHPQPEPQAPPQSTGRPLATLERPGRGRGPDAELRVELDSYQGNPYLNLRVWSRGPDGAWYPTKKGVSVRIGEAEDVADALREGFRLAHVTPARLPSSPARGRREAEPLRHEATAPAQVEPARRPAGTPPTGDYDRDFDEFAD